MKDKMNLPTIRLDVDGQRDIVRRPPNTGSDRRLLDQKVNRTLNEMALDLSQFILDVLDTDIRSNVSSLHLGYISLVLLPVPHIVRWNRLEDFGKQGGILVCRFSPQSLEVIGEGVGDKLVLSGLSSIFVGIWNWSHVRRDVILGLRLAMLRLHESEMLCMRLALVNMEHRDYS